MLLVKPDRCACGIYFTLIIEPWILSDLTRFTAENLNLNHFFVLFVKFVDKMKEIP